MGPLKTQIAKEILRKNKARSTTLPNFKLHYKAIVMKTLWYWNKTIRIWNRIQSTEINLHIYCQLMFDKGVMNTQWGKN